MKKIIPFLLLVALMAGACEKQAETFMPNVAQNGNGQSGSITRFAVYGEYLYALDQNQILVYKFNASGTPVLVNKVKTQWGLETIIIYEETIYVGSTTSLYILDISNPENPVLLSQTDRETDLAGGCDPVVVKGSYAFSTVKIIPNVCGLVSQTSRLLVYDVSDKTSPVLIGSYDMIMPNGLGYKENTLFVCDEGAGGVILFDISNPSDCTPISAIDITDPVDVIVNGNRMVVSTKTGFSFYDVTDPLQPVSMGSLSF
jgi:hypothetical protein